MSSLIITKQDLVDAMSLAFNEVKQDVEELLKEFWTTHGGAIVSAVYLISFFSIFTNVLLYAFCSYSFSSRPAKNISQRNANEKCLDDNDDDNGHHHHPSSSSFHTNQCFISSPTHNKAHHHQTMPYTRMWTP
eukprot:3833255-Rhodomonas_salina.1